MRGSHVRVEVASALRGLWLGGRTTDDEFAAQLAALGQIGLFLVPLLPLLGRLRELARNATAYDAAYLAVAEATGAPLVTLDAKLARVPGTRADVRLVERR